MVSRTYGWVQNPSDFKKLKLTVQIFDNQSNHYKTLRDKLIPEYIHFDNIRKSLLNKLTNNECNFSYTELVGSSRDKDGRPPKTRSDAVADSLIQVTILPQSYRTKGKMWTDNWTADGYLRWALSLNLIQHNRDTDICTITELGLEFSRCDDDSEQELNVLRRALLAYPPASRILSILNHHNQPMTKFAIGSQLGFIGEKGFTSYDESLMLDWLATASPEEYKTIKSDVEGTSDKYARMISGWLIKVGFVEMKTTTVHTPSGARSGFPMYSITARGTHAINQANGSSKNSRIKKYFTWEFLAVFGKNRDYIRTRRSYILTYLKSTHSFSTLVDKLRIAGFSDEVEIIESDIQGMINFGIRITRHGNDISLDDDFYDLTIPDINATDKLKALKADRIKAKFMRETNLPLKYIELLDIAYDNRRNRDFEIITVDLLRNIYGIPATHLGGGRRPDGIAQTEHFGIIIDTKAYGNGYSKSISQEDEMVRYIEDNQLRDKIRNSTEWWTIFNPNIPANSFYFLWVSSKFVGRFSEQLQDTSRRTNTSGAGIDVENLLIGAHLAQKNILHIDELPKYFNNSTIEWSNQ